MLHGALRMGIMPTLRENRSACGCPRILLRTAQIVFGFALCIGAILLVTAWFGERAGVVARWVFGTTLSLYLASLFTGGTD